MKKGLFIAAAVLAVSAWVAPAYAQKDDAKTQRGQKVFTDQKCSLCHSIGGHGNPKGPLDNVGSKLTADEIRQWVTDAKTMSEKTKAIRKPPMKQYNLPKEDVDAVVAYLETLKGTPAPKK